MSCESSDTLLNVFKYSHVKRGLATIYILEHTYVHIECEWKYKCFIYFDSLDFHIVL